MKNTIIYLIGPPGVGKYTIAKLISQASGAQLVDNHYWNNVIFGLVKQDGKTPLDKGIHDNAWSVCQSVLDTISNHSPAEWSFVFTHAAFGNGVERDIEFSHLLVEVAQNRNARLVTVNLRCSESMLLERITNPQRRKRMKTNDERMAKLASLPDYVPKKIGEHFVIDTTTMPANEVATTILKKVH